MKCYKCSKEMDKGDGKLILEGIRVDIIIGDEFNRAKETIDYRNIQLGKYSNGNGECHVAICYECYIDGLFHIKGGGV